MKLTLTKIAVFVLSLLVLFSTVSFSVEKHFCGGELVDISLFSDLEKCDMSTAKTLVIAADNHCCNDEVDVIEGQNDLSLNSDIELTVPQQFFLSNYFHSLAAIYDELKDNEIFVVEYTPPNLIVDIQILDQVFII